MLQHVVLILIPSLNPDGYRLVVDWYNKHKGTPYDGGPMPWLDHPYVGHDINRDGFMMNMAENRNLSRFFYTEWHPQVFLAMHQMPSAGVRFFVPPNVDPIDPNYDPLIWREAALLGSAMSLELERDHHSGVVSNAMYDYYWPGYEDSVPLGHNTVCLLTEAASVRVASPVTVAAGELRAGEKGLAEYAPQVNFPDPWPGGTWTLRNIVDYDLSAVRGLLKAVSAYREPIVQNFYDMGARAVEDGKRGGPFAFVIPPEQHDASATRKLEELLIQGGIEIHRALEPFRADGEPYPAGSDVILLAQPYRAYVKTLLERQNYPARRTPDGAPERPFDAAAWTLPLQMGVDVRTIASAFEPPPMSRVSAATIPTGEGVVDRLQGGVLRRRCPRHRRRDCDESSAGGRPQPAVAHARARHRRLHVPGRLARGAVLVQGRTDRRADCRPARSARRCRARQDTGQHATARARSRRALQALDRKHRRRVDALAARTVRVSVQERHRRRRPRRKPARAVRRHHPAERAGRAADRRPSRRRRPAGVRRRPRRRRARGARTRSSRPAAR